MDTGSVGSMDDTQGVNPDLDRERQKANIDVEFVSLVLYGGLLQKKRAADELVSRKYKDAPNYHYLSRSERYGESIRKSALFLELMKENSLDEETKHFVMSALFPNEDAALTIHLITAFVPTLESQCSHEQKVKWLKKAKNMEIIGSYAQTELGHGTHIRGLETTATYDVKREEFVLHSPTVTSVKFWPGGLGKTANHAAVMAKLYTKGKYHGIHLFIVQIRDLITHMPMPGVTVGDIGLKFGYDTMDNGFLRFDHVRIPRENMLMKNTQVLKDGAFVKTASHNKLMYGTMLYIRCFIVFNVAAYSLAEAVTIAVRYSCVRRQSKLKPGDPEPQVIEFQTQQYRLFPMLATAYAYWFAGQKLLKTYHAFQDELKKGSTASLPELHAVSAGLKAFTTFGAMHGIEQCRLCCGGHGFSQSSGLPKIYVNCAPGCTYEGENTVMLLQTARYLAKSYQQAVSGLSSATSVSYLAMKSTVSSLDSSLSVDALTDAYRHRAARLVTRACMKFKESQASGCEPYDAWNRNSVYFVKAAEAHCHLLVVESFTEKLSELEYSAAVTDVLTNLFRLYAAYGISINSGDFMEDGFLSPALLDVINQGMMQLLARLRPNAVALVDAFDFTDDCLQSVLGRYDGQVYEHLYKWAAASPLNNTQVHESHHYLKNIGASKL